MHFTNGQIAKYLSALRWSQDEQERRVWSDDLQGFAIRFRRGGGHAWIVQYRDPSGRKTKTVTLGKLRKPDEPKRPSHLTLDEAKDRAKQELARVTLGGDPAAEKSRARDEAAITFGSALAGYLEKQEKKLKPRSYHETERYLRTSWQPLHGRGLSTIDRFDIAALLESLSDKHGLASADAARRALSAYFTWAMKNTKARILANPVLATDRPAVPASRDRVLKDAELAEVWRACRDNDFGRIVKLLMLTGQRREEVAGMRWAELHVGEALWSIPASRTKNCRPQDVPLSTAALSVLEGVSSRDDRDLVFGIGDGSFSGFSRSKAALDQRIVDARREAADKRPLAAWRLHDLRRSAATGMAELRVEPHIIEAVLNHVSGHKASVAGTYNRAAYSAQKREALSMWGEHITSLVSGEPAKVVPLHRATA